MTTEQQAQAAGPRAQEFILEIDESLFVVCPLQAAGAFHLFLVSSLFFHVEVDLFHFMHCGGVWVGKRECWISPCCRVQRLCPLKNELCSLDWNRLFFPMCSHTRRVWEDQMSPLCLVAFVGDLFTTLQARLAILVASQDLSRKLRV